MAQEPRSRSERRLLIRSPVASKVTAFAPVPHFVSAWLAELREECLMHSEKRMPKWKFRLAPNFVMQLQPKPTYLPTARQIDAGARIELQRFEGLAVLVKTGTATAALLESLPRPALPILICHANPRSLA